jgi:hypothetical protein
LIAAERRVDADDVPRPGERLGQRRRLLDRAADDRLDDLGELRRMRRGQEDPATGPLTPDPCPT